MCRSTTVRVSRAAVRRVPGYLLSALLVLPAVAVAGVFDNFNDGTLAPAWTFYDADNDATTGAYAESGGQLSLSGRGLDVYQNNNRFVSVWRSDITGDFDVSVKVVSQTSSDNWAKSGILVANDVDALTFGGYCLVAVTPAQGFTFQWDASGVVGELETHTEIMDVAYPCWLRLTKVGTLFHAYYKTTAGGTWVSIGSATPQSTAANSQVALFSCSHTVTTTCTAVFDDFVEAGPPSSNTPSRRVWVASAAGGAGVTTNWTPNGPFVDGDTAWFDGTSTQNCTWDLNVAVGRWTQRSTYTGTVTMGTQYTGGLDTVRITGDALIEGGRWTHRDNSTAETYRLCVKVGGDLIIGPGGSIDVSKRGYVESGPGTSPDGGTAGYGGQGSDANSKTYGSPTAPVNLGSGGSNAIGPHPGGGAALLVVSGATALSGSIKADADPPTSNNHEGSAGGSVFLTTGSISGAGSITAYGGSYGNPGDNHEGGGGRIAVILTGASADFSGFSTANISARSVATNALATVGTIYLQTTAQGTNGGRLWIKGGNDRATTRATTLNDVSGAKVTVGSVLLHSDADFRIGANDTLIIGGTGNTVTITGQYDTLVNSGVLMIGGTGITNGGGFISTASTAYVRYTGQANDAAVTIPAVTCYKLGLDNAGTTFNLPSADVKVTDSVKVLSGTLNQGQGDLRANAVVVWPAAVWRNHSGGNDTLGALGVVNNGTVDFDGGAAGCGDSNTIWIVSSVADSQRTWNGTGSFTLADVNVRDMAGSANITAAGSTNAGNNGANWKFGSCAASYAAWSHGSRIYLNTTATGAAVSGDVYGFPLLVRLDSASFTFNEAAIDGRDLRFASSSGKSLPLEIERWSANDNVAEVWVRIDTVRGNSASQYITMYWGNSSAAGVSDGTEVFGVGDGFGGVYHMARNDRDATANRNDGTGTPGDSMCAIGRGRSFNGTSQFVDVRRSIEADFSITFWMRATGSAPTGGQWYEGAGLVDAEVGGQGTDFGVSFLNGKVAFGTGSPDQTILSDSAVSSGWHHVVATRARATGTKTVYVDGRASGTQVGGTAVLSLPVAIRFGGIANDGNLFAGKLDEVELSTVTRSSAWIKLAYENQKPAAGKLLDWRSAPLTAATPSSQRVLAGSSPSFRVSSDAARPLTYRWYSVTGDSLGADSTIAFPSVAKSFDNTRLFAVVHSATGFDTTAVCTLRVVQDVAARFVVDRRVGLDTLTVACTDSSTGDIARWRWDFGDGDTLAYVTRRPTVTHTFVDTGVFTIQLVVTGMSPAGRDTAESPELLVNTSAGGGNNLIMLSAEYFPPGDVEMYIGGADLVNNDSPLLPLYADSIGLWLSRTGGPIDTSRSGAIARYSVADMKRAGLFYHTVVNVPTPTDTTMGQYLFWASPLCGAGVSPYAARNSALVVMKPRNHLVVVGQYLGNRGTPDSVSLDTTALDSVVVRVASTATVDSVGVGSVELWWRVAGGDVMQSVSLPVADFLRASRDELYTWGISSPVFEADTQSVEISTALVGRNGLRSDTVSVAVVVGWPRPVNPLHLRVGNPTSSRAPLTWEKTDADSIRVLYSSQPVPLGSVSPSPSVAAVVPGPVHTDTTVTVRGLNRLTTYYFAVQIMRNRKWSDVTDCAHGTVTTTDFAEGDLVPNTSCIDSVHFDVVSHRFVVWWHLTPVRDLELELGVTWSAVTAESRTVEPAPPSYGEVVLDIDTMGVDTIDPGLGLRFNATMYVGLWLRTRDGPWAAPTDSSVDTFHTPQLSWQTVRLFEQDTMELFNGTVAVWRDSSYTQALLPDPDTSYWAQVSDTMATILPAGAGFSLGRDHYQPFYVGVHYDQIPPGHTWQEVGLYRDSAGVLLSVPGFRNNGLMVYAKVSDFVTAAGVRMAYVALIDTSHPLVMFASDTGSVAIAGASLGDTFTIVDDVGNLTWRFYYAKDDEPYTIARSAGATECAGCTPRGITRSVSIPGRDISAVNGVRAILIVSDGPHTDTINVSRGVRRERWDSVTTPKKQWVPVWTTAVLDSPGLPQALRQLALPGMPWAYDSTRFRVFRWVVDEQTRYERLRWLEYSDRKPGLFRFEPGRLMWLKTLAPVTIDLGSGTSHPLKEPFEMRLSPFEWTDMALPNRNYSVRAGDILDATMHGDSLEIYQWEQVSDAKGNRVYTTRIRFSSALPVPVLQDKSYTMESHSRSCFSIWNMATQAIALRIPPTPASMSRYVLPLSKARGSADGWSCAVGCRTDDGVALPPVYCGFRSSGAPTTYLPVSPSFLDKSVALFDRGRDRLYGHMVAHRMVDGGFTAEIAFRNDGTSQQVFHYRIEGGTGMPTSVLTRVVDPGTAAWEIPAADGELVVSVKPGGREYRTLAVGDEAFMVRFRQKLVHARLSLGTIFPNPGRGAMRIRYTIPLGKPVDRVAFALFDMRGRIVWRGGSQGILLSGTHDFVWDGRMADGQQPAPGAYVLRMVAFDDRRRSMGSFQTRVIRVR
jgi:hypothetical protein